MWSFFWQSSRRMIPLRLLLLLAVVLQDSSLALTADDVGVLDFTIATAGHGLLQTTRVVEDSMLISTDATSAFTTSTSCIVAARSVETGDLIWRRHVCSSTSSKKEDQQHAFVMSSSSSLIFTADGTAKILQGWKTTRGELLWSTPLDHDMQQLVSLDSSEDDVAAVGVLSGSAVVLYEETTGAAVGEAIQLPVSPKNGERLQWFPASSENDKKNQGLLARVHLSSGVIRSLQWLELSSTNKVAMVLQSPSPSAKEQKLVASSLLMTGNAAWALTVEGSPVAIGADGSITNYQDSTKRVYQSIHTLSDGRVGLQSAAVNGAETTMDVFAIETPSSTGSHAWNLWSSPATVAPVVVGGICDAASIMATWDMDGVKVYNTNDNSLLPIADNPDSSSTAWIPDSDELQTVQMLSCSSTGMAVLISTVGGSTSMLKLEKSSSSVTVSLAWAAEEGLASVSSAIVLDASHVGLDDIMAAGDEDDNARKTLESLTSFRARLSSQMNSVAETINGALTVGGGQKRRDHTFGFVKMAALLSQTSHRMWGLATTGTNRGTIRWMLDLPRSAEWHTMVHGSTNSQKAVHGINGGVHSRELLVLSYTSNNNNGPNIVDWKCVDGTSGAIHAEESLEVPSPISQIIPVYAGTGGRCHQGVLLLHDDMSFSVFPSDSKTLAMVAKEVESAPNGMFTHLIHKEAPAKIESFQIANDQGVFRALQVGRTSFAGERVVEQSYPIRDEVVQSMSTILGDDSLLLKYLNPHLAVIITVVDNDVNNNKNVEAAKSSLVSALESKEGTKQRKPVGVDGNATATKDDIPVPNMFLNLVDTVSGRLLHRSSHSNVDTSRDMAVLISENWVLYSFVNAKSRRTELGVLTLHEGMIGSDGVTLFSSAEQTTSFSSLDARESKPVVLSKTYTFPQSITALGTTATRGGISNRKILIASTDGKVTQIDRKLLETRRPVGEVKETEKKEGLFPYSELIPQASLLALNYNQTLAGVKHVQGSPTALESQSLVFAFGGPDLFFTRTSPSRGFDLLPDSFSRVLVSIVTIGVVIGLFVVQGIGTKKTLDLAWQ